MSNIPRIEIKSPRINNIPKNVVNKIPPATVRNIPAPVIKDIPPPVIRGIEKPVIDIPNPTIEYPTLDVPTEQDFKQQMSPQKETEEEVEDTRDLPTVTPPKPTITIGGVEAPLPEPAPLITAGATALVTTAVTLTATILVGKFKEAVLEPAMKRMEAKSKKKKKIKIKQVKPVLHYVLNEDNTVDVLEYSQGGTRVIDQIDDVERYLRDQVELDSLYELDNRVIIDDVLKDRFTKEGAKRFKSLFAPAKSIAKKLAAKISI